MIEVVLTKTLKWSWRRTNIPCCLHCTSCNDDHYGSQHIHMPWEYFLIQIFVSRRNTENVLLVTLKWWTSLIHEHIIFTQTQILSSSPSKGHNNFWYLKHHKQADNLDTAFYADKLHINQSRATTSRLNVRSLNNLAIKFQHWTSAYQYRTVMGFSLPVSLPTVSVQCF